MPDLAPQKSEIVADGGFRIEIGTDELAVTADRSAWKARKRPILSRVLWILVALVVAVQLVSGLGGAGWGPLVVLVLALGVATIVKSSQRTRNIRCTHDALEIIEVLHNREVGRIRYPREQVRRIEFSPVSYGRYQAIFGLVFNLNGLRVKVLRGIESPEAQIALRELKRLGFDTLIDVGMPMAAEMALERRNSWLGFR